MVDLSPKILIITLIVNILTILFRGRDGQTGLRKKSKKQDQLYAVYKRWSLNINTQAQSERIKRIYHANDEHDKGKMAVCMCVCVCIVDRETNDRTKRTFQSVSSSERQKNKKKSQICMNLIPELLNDLKQKLTKLKGKTDKCTIIENF